MKNIEHYSELIKDKLLSDYTRAFHPAQKPMKFPFIHPGAAYVGALWDWDSWLFDVALRQIMELKPSKDAKAEAYEYEKGCVLNFLEWGDIYGWIPFVVPCGVDISDLRPKNIYETNMHKPVLAQHAAFIVQQENGDSAWLSDHFEFLMAFVNNYIFHHRHKCGLYYWQNDVGVGVDNDPSVFFRPAKSSGSIYLNCLMYKELLAMIYLCKQLALEETVPFYEKYAKELKQAINEHCWDERNGFYYSADLNLVKNTYSSSTHQGMPVHYDCLIQKIDLWTGFMGIWAGIANEEQAERIVNENYGNEKTFKCPYGVRSLSKLEKMYYVGASGNPSPWLGPVWTITNYMTFRGLLNYNYTEQARELAQKTVCMLGKDLDKTGDFHECYQPENGNPIMNKGFLSWNALAINMIAWLENKPSIAEF